MFRHTFRASFVSGFRQHRPVRKSIFKGTSALILSGALLSLSGCATLPSNGPTAHAIKDGVAKPASLPFSLVEISSDTAAKAEPTQSVGIIELSALSLAPAPERADMIRKGDTLSLSIYEVGVTLFAGQNPTPVDPSRAPTAGLQQISAQVHEDGTIELPYVGQIQVAGSYPEAVAAEVRQRLRRYSQNPEVSVSIGDSLRNVVYLSGAIARPGRYRLTAAREKLLDMLSLAGGPADNVNDIELKLVRGDKVARAPLNEIGIEDLANVRLLPGDRVELVRARKTFTVFGATDKVSQIGFDSREVTLAEAVARASGPSDYRANARGVFVFRLEKGKNGDQPRPMVYQLNMMKPESYFLAQMFPVRDKDVILFANSSSNVAQKLIGLVNQLFSPALAVRYATN